MSQKEVTLGGEKDNSWEQITTRMTNKDSICDLYHMVIGLLFANIENFKKLESKRVKHITAKALLDYLCRMEDCNPEDLDHELISLVTKISGYPNIEEFLKNYPYRKNKTQQ